MELGFNAIRYNFSYSGRFFEYSFLHPFKTSTKKKKLASTSINKVEDTVNLQIIIRTELVFALQVQSFVRSGYVHLTVSAGNFRNAGKWGFDWSSRGTDSVWGSAGLGGYNFSFSATGVNLSNGPDNRWIGFPLRCLSTVLGM